MATFNPTKLDVIGADLRERLRAGGAGVQGSAEDDQAILAAAKPEDRAVVDGDKSHDIEPIISIMPTETGLEIEVKTLGDRGKTYVLHPELRYGTLIEAVWIDQQIAKRNEQIEATDDFRKVEKVRDSIHALEHRRMKLSIPDLPDGLLLELDQVQVQYLLTVVQRLTWDAQAAIVEIQKKMLAPYQKPRHDS